MNEYVVWQYIGILQKNDESKVLGQAYPHCRPSSRPAPLGSDTADTRLCNILNSLKRNCKLSWLVSFSRQGNC